MVDTPDADTGHTVKVVDTLTLRFTGDDENGSTLHELRAAHVAEVLQGLVGIASDFGKAGVFHAVTGIYRVRCGSGGPCVTARRTGATGRIGVVSAGRRFTGRRIRGGCISSSTRATDRRIFLRFFWITPCAP